MILLISYNIYFIQVLETVCFRYSSKIYTCYNNYKTILFWASLKHCCYKSSKLCIYNKVWSTFIKLNFNCFKVEKIIYQGVRFGNLYSRRYTKNLITFSLISDLLFIKRTCLNYFFYFTIKFRNKPLKKR